MTGLLPPARASRRSLPDRPAQAVSRGAGPRPADGADLQDHGQGGPVARRRRRVRSGPASVRVRMAGSWGGFGGPVTAGPPRGSGAVLDGAGC